MTDLSDINMDGVQASSGHQELPVGQFLVRIEDTEKKETKEKVDEAGNKLPPNHYLQIALKVYGGQHEGQIEFLRLNLWNTNETAVNMAKSDLKGIQNATGVVSSNSDHYHGKWMVLEIKAGIKDPTKLFKSFHPAPENVVAQFAHIPPVPAKAPSLAASQPVHHAVATVGAATAGIAPATAAAANALPSWAQKK